MANELGIAPTTPSPNLVDPERPDDEVTRKNVRGLRVQGVSVTDAGGLRYMTSDGEVIQGWVMGETTMQLEGEEVPAATVATPDGLRIIPVDLLRQRQTGVPQTDPVPTPDDPDDRSRAQHVVDAYRNDHPAEPGPRDIFMTGEQLVARYDQLQARNPIPVGGTYEERQTYNNRRVQMCQNLLRDAGINPNHFHQRVKINRGNGTEQDIMIMSLFVASAPDAPELMAQVFVIGSGKPEEVPLTRLRQWFQFKPTRINATENGPVRRRPDQPEPEPWEAFVDKERGVVTAPLGSDRHVPTPDRAGVLNETYHDSEALADARTARRDSLRDRYADWATNPAYSRELHSLNLDMLVAARVPVWQARNARGGTEDMVRIWLTTTGPPEYARILRFDEEPDIADDGRRHLSVTAVMANGRQMDLSVERLRNLSTMPEGADRSFMDPPLFDPRPPRRRGGRTDEQLQAVVDRLSEGDQELDPHWSFSVSERVRRLVQLAGSVAVASLVNHVL